MVLQGRHEINIPLAFPMVLASVMALFQIGDHLKYSKKDMS